MSRRPPREGAAPRPSGAATRGRGLGISAAFPGTCPLREQDSTAGATIRAYGEDWVHAACYEAQVATNRIKAGDTFAGNKSSDWRRGKSPGSGPAY